MHDSKKYINLYADYKINPVSILNQHIEGEKRMKVNINQVFAIQLIYSKFKDEYMPIRTAYKFSKILKQIEDSADFYRKQLQNILNKYGQVDENGELLYNNENSVQIKPEFIKECESAINELQTMEFDIDNIPLFTLDELESLELTLQEFQTLIPFIEE